MDEPDEGKIEGTKCKKVWRWKDRMTALPRFNCISSEGGEPAQQTADDAVRPTHWLRRKTILAPSSV